jgi:hypothetical protein
MKTKSLVLGVVIFCILVVGSALGYFYSVYRPAPRPAPQSPVVVKMSDSDAVKLFSAERIIENNLPESIKFTFKNSLCPNEKTYFGSKKPYKIPDGFYMVYCGVEYKKYGSDTYTIKLTSKQDPWVKEEKPVFSLLYGQAKPVFLGNVNKTDKVLFDFLYAKSNDYYGFDRYKIKNQFGESFMFTSNTENPKYEYFASNEDSIFDPAGSHNYGGTGMKILDKNTRYKVSYIGVKVNSTEMFKNLKTEIVYSAHDSFGQQYDFGKIESKSNIASDMLKKIFGVQEAQACGYANLTQDIGKTDLVLEKIENGINWYKLSTPIALYDFPQGPCYDKSGALLGKENCNYCSDCANGCNSYSVQDQRHYNCESSCSYDCFKWSDQFYADNGLRFNIFYQPNSKVGFLRIQVANVILSDENGNYFEPTVTSSSFSGSYNAYLDDPICFGTEVVLPENCP